MEQSVTEPYTKFSALIRKLGLPQRSAYSWKDQGLFGYTQIGQVILVKESEVLSALAKFHREGKSVPYFSEGEKPIPPISPGRPKGSRNKT
jgi:hypothetical protein